jgi:hypothetical protein
MTARWLVSAWPLTRRPIAAGTLLAGLPFLDLARPLGTGEDRLTFEVLLGTGGRKLRLRRYSF